MFCTAYGHAPCAMAVRHDVAKAVGIVAGHGEALGFATGLDEVAPVVFHGYGYGYASLYTAAALFCTAAALF